MSTIKTYLRIRPCAGEELYSYALHAPASEPHIFEIEGRKGPLRFEFEEVFPPETRQADVYSRFGTKLLDCATSGV